MGEYRYDSRIYPEAALDIICCAGLHTDYSQEAVAQYFQNGGLEWWNLNGVTPGELTRLLFRLRQVEHYIYVFWEGFYINHHAAEIIEQTMQPLSRAPRRPCTIWHNKDPRTGSALPIWTLW